MVQTISVGESEGMQPTGSTMSCRAVKLLSSCCSAARLFTPDQNTVFPGPVFELHSRLGYLQGKCTFDKVERFHPCRLQLIPCTHLNPFTSVPLNHISIIMVTTVAEGPAKQLSWRVVLSLSKHVTLKGRFEKGRSIFKIKSHILQPHGSLVPIYA